MAIGKVGSFATVQPAIVDFGGMAKGAIDSVKEDRERKRREQEAAKLKRQQDIQKMGGLGGLKSTNVKGFNQGLESIYANMRKEYAQAKEFGDVTKMRELQEEVFSMNNIVDNVVKQHDFYLKNQDKFDIDYFNRATNVLDNIDIANMEVKRGEDGRVRFTVYGDPERTQVLFNEMTPNEIVDSLKIPYKFDSEAMVGGFVKNYVLDDVEKIINDGGIFGTVKDSKLEDNPRVMSAIETKAKELVNDSKAMAWFGKSIGVYESDSRGFTEEQKEKAYEGFVDKLKNAYKTEYDLAIQKKTGGGGKDDQFNFGTPELFPNVAGIENATYVDIVASGSKKGGIFYSSTEDIVGIALDPRNGQMYPVTAASVGVSSSMGAGDGGVRQGQSTSGRASELKPIETEQNRNATLKRIASSKGFKTVKELQENLFGKQDTTVKFN
jgi:hypothetical protein